MSFSAKTATHLNAIRHGRPTTETSRTAAAVRPVAGYDAQRSLLSPRRLDACHKASQAAYRNQWLADRGGLTAPVALGHQAGLDRIRAVTCGEQYRVDDVQAERMAAAAEGIVAPRERAHDSARAKHLETVDDRIAVAKRVQKVANYAGSVAEAGLGPAGLCLGLARNIAGDVSEAGFGGDEYGVPELAGTLAEYGAEKVAGKLVGAVVPDKVVSTLAGPLVSRIGMGATDAVVQPMVKKAITKPFAGWAVEEGKERLFGAGD